MKKAGALVTIVTNPQSAQPLTLELYVLPDPTGPMVPTRGHPILARVVASGGTGGYVYSLTSGPGWLSINSTTGVLSGTPDTIKTELFMVHVEDSSSTVAEHAFSIEIVSRLTPKWVTPIPGEIGVTYEYTLGVYGATGTVTWTDPSDGLPSGLDIDGSDIVGTPTGTAGITYATLHAFDDGTGDSLDVPVAITIVPAVSAAYREGLPMPVTPYWALPNAVVGVESFYHVDASGGTTPYRYAIFSKGLYTGAGMLTISNEGVIRVLSDGIDRSSTISVKVTDAYGSNVVIPAQLVTSATTNGLQPQQDGTNVGDPGPKNINVTGAGAPTVTNDGTTMTMDFSGGGGGADVATIRRISALRAF